MKLPKSKKQTKNRTNLSNKFNFRGSFSNTLKKDFVSLFLKMYLNEVSTYFYKNNIQFVKSVYNNSKSKAIILSWYNKMKSIDNFPFPIDEEKDIDKYYKIDFWKSSLNTLFKFNDANTVLIYLQTVNGIFKYVESGRVYTDKARLEVRKNFKNISANSYKLTNKDLKYIIGMYILLIHEKVNKSRMKRNKNYYKYISFFDMSGEYPKFSEELLENSSLFKSVLINFEPFYYKLMDFYNLDDYLDYENLLLRVSQKHIILSDENIFSGFDENKIKIFIKLFINYFYGI